MLISRRRAYKDLFEGEIAENADETTALPLQTIHVNPSVSPYTGTMDPIPVDKFSKHVQKMHANDDYLFSEEYNVSVMSREVAAPSYDGGAL